MVYRHLQVFDLTIEYFHLIVPVIVDLHFQLEARQLNLVSHQDLFVTRNKIQKFNILQNNGDEHIECIFKMTSKFENVQII